MALSLTSLTRLAPPFQLVEGVAPANPPDSASLEWRQDGRLHYKADGERIHYRLEGRLQYRTEK